MSNDRKVRLLTRCQITHLTNMNDRERLRLLKDVAGTEVYEQKGLSRPESWRKPVRSTTPMFCAILKSRIRRKARQDS